MSRHEELLAAADWALGSTTPGECETVGVTLVRNLSTALREEIKRADEADVQAEHYKRLKDQQIDECLKALRENNAELARYRALGKEAAEGMPAAQFPNGTNILEWRAMKMREIADLYRETTTKEEA